ncbi:uncharacterized protein LOC110813852 [Carica papaya]|uniref:uncharacterized protein LOC110813852 n=1 Tax=Carica papaya TaxID=3649 RepID=UPI000B8D153F|nr:uncharacterized protein LOC110813852 [Carica papaya]
MLQNHVASMKNLETQIRPLTNVIAGQTQGSLPSNSKTNLKEYVKAITLKNGKVLEEPKQKVKTDKVIQSNPVKINIPFVEALMQMPQNAKFLNNILSNKRKIEEYGTVMLTEERLNLGEMKETRMVLQFADRSTKRPIIKDILVKVGEFIFPVDFVILDMDVESELSLILGRPFLATSGSLIDVKNGKLTLRFNKEIIFDIKKAMKTLSIILDDLCCAIDIIDEFIDEQQQAILTEDNLERCLMLSSTTKKEDTNLRKEVIELEGESLLDNVLGTKEEP